MSASSKKIAQLDFGFHPFFVIEAHGSLRVGCLRGAKITIGIAGRIWRRSTKTKQHIVLVLHRTREEMRILPAEMLLYGIE